MVHCPNCEQPVDETVRTTCPLCFAPLTGATPIPPAPDDEDEAVGPAPAAPATAAGAAIPAPQPAPAAEPRVAAPLTPVSISGAAQAVPISLPTGAARAAGTVVSLTGEIINTNSTLPAQAAAGPARPSALPRAAPSERWNMEAQGSAPRRGSKAGALVLVLLVLLGGGFGGWYWWMHRSDPKATTQQFVTALTNGDWKTVYNLSDLPAKVKSKYPTADAFAAAATQNPAKVQAGLALVKKLLTSATIGDATVSGDTATVPITLHITALGTSRDVTSQVHLKNDSGEWKIQPLTM